MLIKIILAVVLLVVVLVVFIATRPSTFRISRSRTMAASPQVVYPSVNDLHKWTEWSPWEKLDPALKREYSGPPVGTGSVYGWTSDDKKVGAGRMTITDTRPAQGVTIRLEFIKPFAGTNNVQFDFVPSGSGTNVTWTMTGNKNFMMKAFCLFMDMDKMVGPDFEKGLASLDAATAKDTSAANVALK
jgi:hypothetical protein